MDDSVLVSIRLRNDLAANWGASTLLAEGEIGVETDTSRMKIGDGIRTWAELPYADAPLASVAPPSVASTSSRGASTSAARADHTHALPATASFASLGVTGSQTIGGDLTVTGSLVGGNHSHEMSEVSGLSDALGEKAGISHNHDVRSLDQFPSVQGNSGKYLANDGTGLYWSEVSSGAADIANGTGIKVGVNFSGETVISLADTAVNRIFAVDTSDGTTATMTGNITLQSGSNVDLDVSGNVVTISSTATTSSGNIAGVSSVNNISGNVSIAAATGGGITVTESGQKVLLSAAIPSAATTVEGLSAIAAVGTSGSYARADHKHPFPNVNNLAISADLNYSGFNVKHSSNYTVSAAPTATSVPGLFALLSGDPYYSDGSGWVQIAEDGHNHTISDVSGLSGALATIPQGGSYVTSVNGQSPDGNGAVIIEAGLTAVSWSDVAGRPTRLSSFTNDGNGGGTGAFVNATGAAAAAPVQSVAGRTGAVTIAHGDVSGFKDGVFGSVSSGTGITVSQDPATKLSVISIDSDTYVGEPQPEEPNTDTPISQDDLVVEQQPAAEFDATEFYGSQAILSYKASNVSSLSWYMRSGTADYGGSLNWQPVATSTLIPSANWSETDNGDGSGYLAFTVSDDMNGVEVKCEFDGLSQGQTIVESSVTKILVRPLEIQTTGTLSRTIYSDSTAPAGLAVVVVKNPAGPRLRVRWQASRVATSSELSDPNIGTYLNRGPLYQNLLSGNAGSFTFDSGSTSELRFGSPALDPSVISSVEREFGTDGSVYRVIQVRAVIEDAVDSFTLLPSSTTRVAYSEPLTIRVIDPPPTFTAQPQDDTVQSGEAQFTASIDADFPIKWNLGVYTVPTRLSPSVVRSESNGVYTETLTLKGITSSDIGKEVTANAMVMGQQVASSQAAKILGSRPSVLSLVSDVTQPYVESQAIELTATVRLEPGTYSYRWVSRSSSGSTWGPISTSETYTAASAGDVELSLQDAPSVGALTGGYQAGTDTGSYLYALQITEGSLSVADQIVTSPSISVTWIPVTVTNVSLGNQIVETGNYFSGFSHTGSLISSSTPHYAIVRMQVLDGSFQASGEALYHRTSNGLSHPEYAFPKQFGVSGAGSSYLFGQTTPSSAVQVELLVNTEADEVDINTATRTITAPPWLMVDSMGTHERKLSEFADETITLYEARQRFPIPSSYSGGLTESWTVRAGLPGWTVAATGRIVLGITSRVSVASLNPYDIPRDASLPATEKISYNWKWQGVARDDDTVLAWPVPNGYSRNFGILNAESPVPFPYLFSDDEGVTWKWVGLPQGCSAVHDIQVWNGKFLGIFHYAFSGKVIFESTDGINWTSPTVLANRGKPVSISVANGLLFYVVQTGNYASSAVYDVYNTSMQLLHSAQSDSRTPNFYGGVRYVGGQYITAELTYANSYTGPWRYVQQSGNQTDSSLQATPVSLDGNSYTLGFATQYADYNNAAFFIANAGEVVDEDGAAPGLILSGMDSRIAMYKQLCRRGSQEILGIASPYGGSPYGGYLYGSYTAAIIEAGLCLGPQVGKYIYASVGRGGEPGTAGGSIEILKIYAGDPAKTRFIPPVSDSGVVGYDRYGPAADGGGDREPTDFSTDWGKVYRLSGAQTFNNNFRTGDADYRTPDIIVHAYRYGPDDEDDVSFPGVSRATGTVQLSDNYLDGTDTPCYGDRNLIFTRNRVIRLYCPILQYGSRWWGEHGEAGPNGESPPLTVENIFDDSNDPDSSSGDGWWNYFPILR